MSVDKFSLTSLVKIQSDMKILWKLRFPFIRQLCSSKLVSLHFICLLTFFFYFGMSFDSVIEAHKYVFSVFFREERW